MTKLFSAFLFTFLLVSSAFAEGVEFPFTRAETTLQGRLEDSDNIESVTVLSPGRYQYKFKVALPTEDYRVNIYINGGVPFDAKIHDASKNGFTLDTIEKSTGRFVSVKHQIYARLND